MPTRSAPALPATPLHIQPATEQDIPTIIELAEATWEPTYRFIISKEQIDYMYRVIYTPASLRRQMREQHHQFLLAYVEGHPSGFASYSEKPEGVYHLNKIYVLPSHQGQGLGQNLVEAVVSAVREAGGKALELNVNRHNPALAFYERQGFAQHREEDIPIGPYWMNDYVLRKEL
ncbi:GNAT family N-acetyltransferase [Hymenobacter ginsengisoli]|uniref:GNAT family N-acetyltransferase n=1 Tax=Hymenobacter ginsengisoli TaxID=1051626 RepID=A0ABP8QN97_9BACT|nr:MULTISPECIES: GNAT family N-acetyltransferase [unclassified Hymenobacter]MBO2031153.1 GNAT family N-acetyltransferase [Hymenobacter sp. BT559]